MLKRIAAIRSGEGAVIVGNDDTGAATSVASTSVAVNTAGASHPGRWFLLDRIRVRVGQCLIKCSLTS